MSGWAIVIAIVLIIAIVAIWGSREYWRSIALGYEQSAQARAALADKIAGTNAKTQETVDAIRTDAESKRLGPTADADAAVAALLSRYGSMQPTASPVHPDPAQTDIPVYFQSDAGSREDDPGPGPGVRRDGLREGR